MNRCTQRDNNGKSVHPVLKDSNGERNSFTPPYFVLRKSIVGAEGKLFPRSAMNRTASLCAVFRTAGIQEGMVKW